MVVAQLAALLRQSALAVPWAHAVAHDEPLAAAAVWAGATAAPPVFSASTLAAARRDPGGAAARAAPTLAAVEASRAAVEDALRSGMAVVRIGDDGDALPAAASPLHSSLAVARQHAIAASAAHGALDDARDRMRAMAALGGGGAPPECRAGHAPPRPLQLLPAPARLVPLTTRRCLSCRGQGLPGLLAAAGGPSAAADATAAAVAHGVWYKRLSAAAAIVPRVQLLLTAPAAAAASGGVRGGGGGGGDVGARGEAGARPLQRLRVYNPLDVPIAVALVVAAARKGAAAGLSAATFVALPLATDGTVQRQQQRQPVGGAVPDDIDVTCFGPPAAAAAAAAAAGEDAAPLLVCVVLHIPSARTSSLRGDADGDDGHGGACDGGGDGGGGGGAAGSPLPLAARDPDNPARSPLWAAPALPATACVVGDGFVEVGVEWDGGEEEEDEEAEGAGEDGHGGRRVGVVAALPAAALRERTGASSLPPAALAARCTLGVVVLVAAGRG
jgi:hypothetical protein